MVTEPLTIHQQLLPSIHPSSLPSISSRVDLLSSHSSPWPRLCNRTPIITTSPRSPASSSTVSPFPSPSPRLSNASSPLQPQTLNLLPLESAEKNGSILLAKPGPFRGLTTSLALPPSTSQRRRITPLPPPPTTQHHTRETLASTAQNICRRISRLFRDPLPAV